jgi:outer membrane lipoprotein-sorting protein
MEGTEVYVLKLTLKDGDIQYHYIDAENYVLLKRKGKNIMEGQEVEMEWFLSNYQDVGGYIQPFTTEMKSGGQTGMVINVDEVKYNEDIDDSIFDKPVAPPPPPEEK